MKNNKINKGKTGENIAAEFLEKNGYKILYKNYRCRYGEIDIVAQNNDVTVFVEVKLRNSTRYGTGTEAITQNKINKLSITAEYYISTYGEKGNYRFDIISIDAGIITHIENAFTF